MCVGHDNSPQHNSGQAVGGQPRRHGHRGRGGLRHRLRGAPQVCALRILQQGHAEEGHRGHQGSAGRGQYIYIIT